MASNSVHNSMLTIPTGTVVLGLLAGAATAQVTITDAAISTTTVLLLTVKQNSTTPGAGAKATVTAHVVSQTAGSAIVQYTNNGANPTLATDYLLTYAVFGT